MAAPPRPPRLKEIQKSKPVPDDGIPYGLYSTPNLSSPTILQNDSKNQEDTPRKAERSEDKPPKLFKSRIPQHRSDHANNDSASLMSSVPSVDRPKQIRVPARKGAVPIRDNSGIYESPRRWSDTPSERPSGSANTSKPVVSDRRPESVSSENVYEALADWGEPPSVDFRPLPVPHTRKVAIVRRADRHIYDIPPSRRWSDEPSRTNRSAKTEKTVLTDIQPESGDAEALYFTAADLNHSPPEELPMATLSPRNMTGRRPESVKSENVYDMAAEWEDLPRVPIPPRGTDRRLESVPVETEYDIAKDWGDLPVAAPKPPNGDVTLRRVNLAGAQKSEVVNRPPKPLNMTHSSKVEEDKIKIILELKSSERDALFSRVPMRLVCLFDISGSMGQQIGAKTKRRRDTKIVKMRNVAKILTNTLDEMDYLGVLAFGNDTEILSPLTKNEPRVKKEVLSKVRELGRNGLSLTTNLSRGLFAAIDMFRQDSKQRGLKHFDTRDVIVVLTDGDINDGLTDGQTLVREVRQAIRELEVEGDHYSKEPGLTISTVLTGNNVAEAVYLLSKTCGSDAFYYIEKDTDTLEIGTLMPVMLRMTSVANSISIQAKAMDPAEMLPKYCSHEYMGHLPSERDEEIWYFLHDLGMGISKHLLIVLDKESVMCETDPDEPVLEVKVEYRDAMMEKHSFTHQVLRGEFESQRTQQSLAVNIQDIRRISQLALRSVADYIKVEKNDMAVVGLLQSIEEVEGQVQAYCAALSKPAEEKVLTGFAESVSANLNNLITVIEDSQKTPGNKWSAVKSVSSAIVREAPSAIKLLGEDTRYLKREAASPEETDMRKAIQDQYRDRGVKSAIFYDFDVTLEELSYSLQRGIAPPYFADDAPKYTSVRKPNQSKTTGSDASTGLEKDFASSTETRIT